MRRIAATMAMAAVITIGTVEGGEKTGMPDPAVAAAVQKTAGLGGYSFAIDEQPGQGTGGKFQGTYQKGQPIAFTADNIEFLRQGKALAYKDGGKWHKSKTGIESDPLKILGGAAKVRGARLPHEELPELTKLASWNNKPEDGAKGTKIYSGTLDATAAKKLAPTALEAVAQGGQAKLWLGADGHITQYTISIKLQGQIGNAQVDGTMTRTVTLGDLGSAKVQVPDEAKKALE